MKIKNWIDIFSNASKKPTIQRRAQDLITTTIDDERGNTGVQFKFKQGPLKV